MIPLLVYRRCKTIKNVLETTKCKFLMTNRSKLLSEFKSEWKKTLERDTTKNMKVRESYETLTAVALNCIFDFYRMCEHVSVSQEKELTTF